MICGGRQHLQHDHPGDAAGQHAGGARPPHQQNPAAALQLLPRLPSIRGPRGKVYNNIMRSPPEEPHLALRVVTFSLFLVTSDVSPELISCAIGLIFAGVNWL